MLSFRNTAIESANLYYKFLDDKGKGIVTIGVRKIANVGFYFDLYLDSSAKQYDLFSIKINNDIQWNKNIKKISYDRKKKVLRICPNEKAKEVIQEASPKDVVLESDLKYLVQRVGSWYSLFGDRLHMPMDSAQIIAPIREGMTNPPSEEQKTAITGILTFPFSYVWGAPGTGKTQFVLANCALAYFQEKQRILITAPTNSAVEQTLCGILSIFESANLDYRGRIIRLGVPSAEFDEKYSCICENSELARNLSELSDKISAAQARIKKLEQLLPRYSDYQTYRKFQERFNQCEDQLPRLFEKLFELRAEQAIISSKKSSIQHQVEEATDRIERIGQDRAGIKSSISYYQSNIDKYNTSLKRRLHSKKIEKYSQQIVDRQSQLDTLQQEEKSIQERQSEWTIELKSQKEREKTVAASIQNTTNEITRITVFWTFFMENCKALLGEKRFEQTKLEEIIGKCGSILSKKKNEFSVFENSSQEEMLAECERLRQQVSQLKEEKKQLEEYSTSVNISNCYIIAATIDTCISRLSPDEDISFSHIFLDEAGYCSLIKGATLMAYGCPVTFLGDHMQLPPVCEMGENEFHNDKNAPVTLWAQSALYAEDIFVFQPQVIFQRYVNHENALFQLLRKFDLLHTYRFGEALAEVLSESVYARGFHGNDNHDTDIYYINAPKPNNAKPRTNPKEVSAIERYIKSNKGEEIGIITPYKAQRKQIKDMLWQNHYPTDGVLTVHGSQGREWDTVLFSIVDTSDKWFTDSLLQISNGKNIVNTAVSRAKKKLIIVCDYNYWCGQKNQLIAKLLSVAENIEKPDDILE